MCPFDYEIQSIKRQIVDKYKPVAIYLFGSCAQGVVTKRSDIDICVIKDVEDKRMLVREILLEVDYKRDLDVVVYREQEWEDLKLDPSTFAYLIETKGVKLFG